MHGGESVQHKVKCRPPFNLIVSGPNPQAKTAISDAERKAVRDIIQDELHRRSLDWEYNGATWSGDHNGGIYGVL